MDSATFFKPSPVAINVSGSFVIITKFGPPRELGFLGQGGNLKAKLPDAGLFKFFTNVNCKLSKCGHFPKTISATIIQ